MTNLILQLWAGIFYLLNKIFFGVVETVTDSSKKRDWRVRSWVVYLVGLPAWLYVFVSDNNWIAFAVEFGGAPAMVLGLIIALREGSVEEISLRTQKNLDYFARITITIGLVVSLYDFGGITTLNQVLELGMAIGFLLGTYMLAKKNPNGYLFFLLMNGSNAWLMGIQYRELLMWQQIISFVIVLYAYLMNRFELRGRIKAWQ